MKKSLQIPYGDTHLDFNLPEENFVEFLPPNEVALPESEEEEIQSSLDEPFGLQPIERLVDPSSQITILCEDNTRHAQTDKMIAHLVERLGSADISDEQIEIVFALGTHRKMSEAEQKEKIGPELFNRFKVRNSKNQDPQDLKYLGEAPGGVRVWVDSDVYESDFIVGVGSIVPHPAAGYTGGAKIIYPGIVGQGTVSQFHLLSASIGNLIGVENNQAREAMESWVETVGLDYIVNAVVSPQNEIYRVVSGDYVKAHREGTRFAREIYGIKAQQEVDMAIVSSHTADLDFWQAGKGITNCESIVKDGGLLILVTPCPEGFGPHPSYQEYLGSSNPDELIESTMDSQLEGEELEDALPLAVGSVVSKISQRIDIAVVSEGLVRAEVKECGLLSFEKIEDAVEYGLQRMGSKAQISVVPFGADSFVYTED